MDRARDRETKRDRARDRETKGDRARARETTNVLPYKCFNMCYNYICKSI